MFKNRVYGNKWWCPEIMTTFAWSRGKFQVVQDTDENSNFRCEPTLSGGYLPGFECFMRQLSEIKINHGVYKWSEKSGWFEINNP